MTDAGNPTALLQEIRDFVRSLVARGDRPFGDILDETVEHVLEEHEDADADFVTRLSEQEIDAAFAAHLASQSGWPEVTDCDLLDRAFETLNAGGIVAEHDFTCCQTCGLAEIGEPIQAAIDAGVDVSGFVFYHAQDTDGAVEGQGLHLTYGHVDGDPARGVAIGRIVVSTLNEAGLETEWDETFGTRIRVLLAWQRRIPASAVLQIVGT